MFTRTLRLFPDGPEVAAGGAASPAAASGNEGGRTSGWHVGQLVEHWCDGDWWKGEVRSISSFRGVCVGYVGSPEEPPVWVAACSIQLRAKTDSWDEPVDADDTAEALSGARRSTGAMSRQSDASRPSGTSSIIEVCTPRKTHHAAWRRHALAQKTHVYS
jgi:hypothetical protein